METASELRQEGLNVSNVIVFLDRSQGGKVNLENNGIKVHAVLNVNAILEILHSQGKIGQDQKREVETFILTNSVDETKESIRSMSLEEREKRSQSEISKKLLRIMRMKKSNLCLSLDVTTKNRLLELADTIGPQICCLKTHMDILMDFDSSVISDLKALADKHDFVILEDRKLADIGKTVQEQMKGPFQIADWADLVTVHGNYF